MPSKYEGNSWDIFLLLHTQKRTAKILIAIQYQQSSHPRYAIYFCWTDSWTGNDAKLDRFLKRLEGAASHFGSPPQIRIARPGVFRVHLFLDLGEEMEPNSKSTLRLKSERWSQPELSTSLPQHTAPHVNCPEFHPPWLLQSGTTYLYMTYENRMYVMKIRFNTALSDKKTNTIPNLPKFS